MQQILIIKKSWNFIATVLHCIFITVGNSLITVYRVDHFLFDWDVAAGQAPYPLQRYQLVKVAFSW
jgi:hypothetical protein